MADLRINPDKLESLLRRYRPDATTRDGSGGTRELFMHCPFHPDSSPSFTLNLHKGVGYCFSCPTKKGYTLEETIAKFEGKTARQCASLLKKEGVYEAALKEKEAKALRENKPDGCGITEEEIDSCARALHMNAAKKAELVGLTGWSDETLRKFKIGWTGMSFSIPLYVGSILSNVRYYTPAGKQKYTGVTGHNDPVLWPMENLSRPGVLWLMEGEKDCVLANQCGLNAVTFTGGAKTFPMDYLMQFKGRDVNILYDIDAPGREGALNAANILSKVADIIKIIELPTQGLPPNGDFTDFIHGLKQHVTELQQIAAMTESFKRQDSKTKVVVSDQVTDTYLESIIPKKQFFRRVRMRVRAISIAQNKTYLVPKETVVSCNRDLGDQCVFCALNFTEGSPLTLNMKPEYPEIMKLIDSDDTKQKAAIKALLELYPKCPKPRYDFKEFQALYPVVFIPALEKDKPAHSYMMQVAWALDVPAEANEDYLCEAVVMTNPDTQEMVIIAYKLDKDLQSVDQFELTPDMAEGLKVFQCLQQPTSIQN